MKKMFGIILLMGLCAQGMEENSKAEKKAKQPQVPQGKLVPYTKREEIGQLLARSVNKEDFPVDDTTKTFYVMGRDKDYFRLRRIPLITEHNSTLGVLKEAFDALLSKDAKSRRPDPRQRIVYDLHGRMMGLNLDNINEPLPLFMLPGVTFKKGHGNVWFAEGDLTGSEPAKGKWEPETVWGTREKYQFLAYATRLQAAVLLGDWRLAEMLIQHGADPEVVTATIQRTPKQLLIDLARYEQEQLGKVKDYDAQTIEVYQNAAEAFASEQWDRMIAANTPTRYNNVRNALIAVGPTIKPVIKPAILILFALALFLFLNGGSKVPEL